MSSTNYIIVGKVSCPYFARSERIGEILKQELDLGEENVEVQSKHPDDWDKWQTETCNLYGFQVHLARLAQGQTKGNVLVWNPRTARLVGGEREFRKEVQEKYGIHCDLDWGVLRAIAAENLSLYDKRVAYKAKQEKEKRTKHLGLMIAGPPASGKSTQASLLQRHFDLCYLTEESVIEEAMQLGTKHGEEAKELLLSGAKSLPPTLITQLVLDRLTSDEVKERGYILDGFPTTEKQGRTLENNGLMPDVFLFLQVGVEELVDRHTGRRTDPATGVEYHLSSNPPDASNAKLMARLVQSPKDSVDQARVRIGNSLRKLNQVQGVYRNVEGVVNGGPGKNKQDVNKSLLAEIDRVLGW